MRSYGRGHAVERICVACGHGLSRVYEREKEREREEGVGSTRQCGLWDFNLIKQFVTEYGTRQ